MSIARYGGAGGNMLMPGFALNLHKVSQARQGDRGLTLSLEERIIVVW